MIHKQKEIETISPKSGQEWREWLENNHDTKQSVWLIYYKKESGQQTISWSEAVDEALCFGWVDSKKLPIDGEKYMQFFSKRKSNGTWSKVNKAKILLLIEEGRMSKAGFDCIESAKQNGSWTILDNVEELEIPEDLEKQFGTKPGSREHFSGLSKSVGKAILQWLVLAKRPETRQKRITEIVDLTAQKLKPRHLG